MLPSCGEEVARLLGESGVPTLYKTYPVEHGAHPEELRALKGWMEGVFSGE